MAQPRRFLHLHRDGFLLSVRRLQHRTGALLYFLGVAPDLRNFAAHLGGKLWDLFGKIHCPRIEEVAAGECRSQQKPHRDQRSQPARHLQPAQPPHQRFQHEGQEQRHAYSDQDRFCQVDDAEHGDHRDHDLGDRTRLDRGLKDFLFLGKDRLGRRSGWRLRRLGVFRDGNWPGAGCGFALIGGFGFCRHVSPPVMRITTQRLTSEVKNLFHLPLRTLEVG